MDKVNRVNFKRTVNEIFQSYKKVNIYKIYFDEKTVRRIKYTKIIMTSIYFISIILLFYLMNKFKNNNKLEFGFLTVFIFEFIFLLGYYKCVERKVAKKINAKLFIDNEFKHSTGFIKVVKEFQHSTTFIKIAKEKELINYLNSVGIKSKEQKSFFVSLLIEEYKNTKISDIWFLGASVVLLIPVWNKIVDMNMTKHNIDITCIIIVIIVLVMEYFRLFLFKNILILLNGKSRTYKEMYILIQESLLLED